MRSASSSGRIKIDLDGFYGELELRRKRELHLSRNVVTLMLQSKVTPSSPALSEFSEVNLTWTMSYWFIIIN